MFLPIRRENSEIACTADCTQVSSLRGGEKCMACFGPTEKLLSTPLAASWFDRLCIVRQVYHRPGWCQLFVYTTYVACFLSVWYVVCFTVERYLMIRFPLKRQELCRPGRAKAVVASLAVVALILYNFAIWTSGVSEFPFDKPFCQVRAHISSSARLASRCR